MPRPGDEIGKKNREAVAAYFAANPGSTKRDCGRALQLSEQAIARHCRALKG